MQRTVIVRDLELMLSIGVHAHEKLAPQRLVVSVEATLSGEGDAADNIAATLDYDRICDFIRAIGNEGHVELQETVARRVLAFVLSLPGVASAVVETRKPDVFDDCAFVGARLHGCNE
ncbi:MAG TPA: dihydroneopterin aldolase [Mesorhizobium sp.]